MRILAFIVCLLLGGIGPAIAESSCPGNPDALGTSRTITVEPSALPRIGTIQYKNTVPLADHEVVITFDDGPLPPYTNRVLDALAAECVKVTYFLVGSMAHAYPALVRRIYNEGHVIGTHSQSHPLAFGEMGQPRIEKEVQTGIASVTNAVGDPRAVAPFFRIPGLARSKTVENFLAEQSLAVWSADEVADDWHRGITAKDIVRLAIKRIEARDHRGVLLLHDIHPATAMAVPVLLKELKARGYRIVQAVPAGERLKSVPPLPETQVAYKDGWPRVVKTATAAFKKPIRKIATMRHREHREKKLAHSEYDPLVTASVASKKRKHKTATTEARGLFWFLQ